MTDSATPEPQPLCENCKTPHDPGQKFCQQCSFPVGGTDSEKQAFRLNVGMHQQWLREANKETGTSKTIIYVLSGLFLLFGLYQGLAVDDFSGMITNLVVCVVFLVLAAWADHNPFGAILTAFIIYLTIQVFNFFLNPASLFAGIIWKVIIISGFVKGIRSAQEAQRLRKKLEELKAV